MRLCWHPSRCQDALYFGLRFLKDFWWIFAPNLNLVDLKKPSCSFGKKKKQGFVEKSPLEVNIDFCLHLGLNCSSFWHPKSIKIFPKIDSKRHYKIDPLWDRFLIDFGSVLSQVGVMLATFFGLRTPKRPPRPLQDASKTPPRQSKMPSKTFWIPQDGPRRLQSCPGALQTSIFCDF